MTNEVEEWENMEEITSENDEGTENDADEGVVWVWAGVSNGDGGWSGKKRRKIV